MSSDYVKGSVIVCQQCGRPIYALERGLGALDRAGRSVDAFRPLTDADLVGLLMDRPDVPPLWQANVAEWWASTESYRTKHAARPTSGDPAVCPNCGQQWCTIVERLEGSALDRGYTITMNDIPPLPITTTPSTKPKWKWIADVRDQQDDLAIEERRLD